MTWKKFGDEPPPLDKLVLILKEGKEKYNIAVLNEMDIEEIAGGIAYNAYWVTQHGSMSVPSDNDYWMDFPYLTLTQVKEFK